MFDLVMDENYQTLYTEERPAVAKWLEDRPHLNWNQMTVYAGRECLYVPVSEYLQRLVLDFNFEKLKEKLRG